MSSASVRTERDGRVVTLTLNRPDKMNPLDWNTVRELGAICRDLDGDDAVGVVVITGSGRAFSAGGDLAGYLSLYGDHAGFRRYLSDFHALLDGIERSPRVFMAAINGACVAGGLELMLACDIVVAAETAKIGDGHVNFRQLPGAGGSQRLPRAIAPFKAKLLMLTGRLIEGIEAERIGLVSLAVPADRLDATVKELCDDLLAKSPAGLRTMKHLINQGLRGGLESGLQLENAVVHNWATADPDATEGLRAFSEKRKPMFVSR